MGRDPNPADHELDWTFSYQIYIVEPGYKIDQGKGLWKQQNSRRACTASRVYM
jgi:hypothetical protein